MQLVLSKRFQKDLDNLSNGDQRIQPKIRKVLGLLQKNVKHRSLRLHKLSGSENWSVSVDMDIRVIIHRDDDILFLLRIGHHDEVY